jgi:PPM family protein phosphatase
MDLFRRIFGQSESGDKPSPAPEKPAVPAAKDSDKLPETAPADPPGTERPKTAPITTPPAPVAETAPERASPVTPPPMASMYMSPDGATRQLAPEKAIVTSDGIMFGIRSDTGRHRPNNQDSAFGLFTRSCTSDSRPDFGLFIVADGMGGHADGEKASALAVRTASTHIMNNVFLPMLDDVNDSDRVSITDAMTEAAQKANDIVMKHVKGSGTTLTICLIIGDLAHIAHVGDSRLYLISADGIEQVTRDHSLVQRLIELDHITTEEAAGHSQASVLYRAIGQSDFLEVDTATRRLHSGARIVMCSDGLWGEVVKEDILALVLNTPNPQDTCDNLIALANTRGGKDNITAIVVRMPK